MSDWDDRRLDAEFDRYMDNRTPEEIIEDESADFENDIQEAAAKYKNLDSWAIENVLENYIEFLKQQRQRRNGIINNNKTKNEMTLRINEALARANTQGKKVFKKDIAARLWPDSTAIAQNVNMTNLCCGKTQKINPDWVGIICEMLDCTADFLFGLSND